MRKYSVVNLVIASLWAFTPSFAHTKEQPRRFRVAAIYPLNSATSPTVGNQAICVTQAVVTEAKLVGIPIDLEIMDNQRSAVQTSSVAKQIVKARYDMAIGTLDSSEAIVASEILNDAKIPFIATTASHPAVTAGKPNSFRIQFQDYRQADLLSKYAVERLRPNRVTVIRNTSLPYSDFLGQQFANRIRERSPKTQIVELTIIDGHSDFSGLLTSSLESNPDVVFLPLLHNQLAPIYAELARRKTSIKLLGGDTVGGYPPFLKMLGQTSPAIRFDFVRAWNGDLTSTAGMQYEQTVRKHCPASDVTSTNVSAYDAAIVAVATIKAASSQNQAGLITLLKKLKVQGVTGLIDYSQSGDPSKPINVYKIRNNSTVFLEKYE